jgi:3-phenylpropionate/trans-cinnamate dioxygenase ferredoxin reductase subunit
LRDGGFRGAITLVGAEAYAPYERPHLSKGYLLGTVSRAQLPLRPAIQYRELDVELVLGRSVEDLGLRERRVLLDDGKTIGWDMLCIATGSAARLGDRAFTLRDLGDADVLRARLAAGKPLRILGAGFIGCEVAAAAVQKGCPVEVFEALEAPLARVLGPELGGYLAGVHLGHGVDLRLGAAAESADLVAIGSVPRIVNGVDADGGILVDDLGRTSADAVFAAGDVTRFFHPLYETRIRVEHFQTAQRQGFAVGRTMAGAPTPYEEVPWFWSDQYDLNIQYAGAGLPWDEIAVRGELGKPPFTVFYLSGGRLVAAAGVNDHHTIARARRVMETRGSPTRVQLEDPSFDLRRALAG